MPYIKEEDRVKFDDAIEVLSEKIEVEGDLNYCISLLCHKILQKKGVNYQNVNNIMGALECAKLEFYRVVAAPYENVKMDVNGRISNLDETFFKISVK
jgi:hypothetical protein